MPSLFSRLRPCPGRCPRCWCWRRPLRRLLLPPPPPEGLPGPAFIVLSNCCCWSGAATEFRTPDVPDQTAGQGCALAHSITSAQLRVTAGIDLERTPPQNELLFSNEPLLSVSRFSVIGSVRRRLGTAGAKGLRGNEA